jgi:hypothetical protein
LSIRSPILLPIPFRILPFLSSEGYETWAISSGYLPDEVLPVENLVDSATMNEFELVSLMNTGLLDDLDQLAPEFRADQLLERLLEQQQSLGEIARHSSLAPQFVFMHMPAPHYPFLVDDDCRARSFEDVVPSEVRAIGQWGDPRSVAYYNAQTRCTERLMLDAVDVINSARPDAIILVMSDHGPGEHLNWFAPSNAAIEERMANFFAARTPGYADPFGPDISAVNILPALLNSSLGTNLPYQPTDQWFGPILGKGTFVRVANGYASN